MKVIFSISFLVIIGFFITSCNPAKIDLAAMDLVDLNGESVDLEELKGNAVFLNLWATWCAPCVKEMPSINDLQDKVDKKVKVILISDEPIAKIKSFQKKQGLSNMTFYKSNVVLGDLGISSIPVTYFINTDGKAVHKFNGGKNWDHPQFVKTLNHLAAN